MKLELKRIFKGETYTIGKLYIDGKYFCDTIEDKVRVLPVKCPNTPKDLQCACAGKVYEKTAIPAGTYSVSVNFSTRFKRKLPRIFNVPHFLGILMHNGGTEKASSGCIILGENKTKGRVENGTFYMNKLTAILAGVTGATITIS